MIFKRSSKHSFPIWYFLISYPGRSAFVVVALLTSGLMEAISFAAMIPLLGFALQQDKPIDQHGILQESIAKLFDLANYDLTLGSVLILIVSLMAFKSFLSFYAMKEVGYICTDMEKEFRKKLVNSVLYAEWNFHLNNKMGDFSSAISIQVTSACNVFRATGLVFAGLLQVSLFSVMSLTISLPITLGGVLLGFIVMLLLRKFVTLARISSQEATMHEGKLLSTLIDGLRDIKSNKAMGQQKLLQHYLGDDINKLARLKKKIVLSSAALKNFQEPVQVLGIAATVFFITTRVQFPIDELLILILLFYRTGQRLGNMQIYYQQIATAIPPFWFVFDIIQNAERQREELFSGHSALLTSSILFEKVCFSYGSKKVLSEIDLEIKFGEFITILGPSGGGKTTLGDLLLRFNDPDMGVIKIDGKNINGLSKSSLRAMIGYVPQETILFHDTIRNNITFGDLKMTDKQVQSALHRAGAMGFVEDFPAGLYFVVGEHGGRLSGGQRQRIGLARALLLTPKILILDEPTSALDKVNEEGILMTLKELSGSVTIIAITHQQTFAGASDNQYLLENGKLLVQ